MVRRAGSSDAVLAQPVRTCVGCRQRATASELLRVVAIQVSLDQFRVVSDPRRRAPGRGAHLHPTPACLALAERRRAFGRALRVSGVLDTGQLREAILGEAISPGDHSAPPQGGTERIRLGQTDAGATEFRPEAEQGRTTDMSTR